MTSVLEWLLDLENIRLARDAPLLWRWENRIPAWLLFGIGLVAAGWIVGVYRRETLPSGRKAALVVARAAVMALVVAVWCQPAIVLQRNRVEPAQTVLLVDSSLSMATKEPLEPDSIPMEAAARGSAISEGERWGEPSRLDLVQAALLRDGGAAIKLLSARNGLQLSAFDTELKPLAVVSPGDDLARVVEALRNLKAEGAGTDVAGALIRVMEKGQGRRIAAMVLASDGQSTEPGVLRDAIDLARGRQIPVFTMRVGLSDRPVDIEVGDVRAQESVFADDLIAVEAEVRVRGLTAPMPVRMELVDERSGAILATREEIMDPGRATNRVELRAKPSAPGLGLYRVRAAALSGERMVENNSGVVSVDVVEEKLRLLYVEGYPRYEYRFLKNACLREKTMQLSVLLLEADEQFVQEGTFPIRRFPESPEELSRFDVVIFGDVDPRAGWLTEAQMKMLLDFVGNEGGGFGLIAGGRFAPQRFLGTPLERLVPARIDPTFLGVHDGSPVGGFHARLTPEGRRSRLFQGIQDAPVNDHSAPEIDSGIDPNPVRSAETAAGLPEWYWFTRTLGPKPGATVLAEHATAQLEGDTARGPIPYPLVVSGRYGAGKLFFQATDDTWRWRRHTGELIHDTYWVQAAREIMRTSRAATDRRLLLHTDRRVYRFGETVQVQAEILDEELLATVRDSVALTLQQEDKEGAGVGSSAVNGTLTRRVAAARLGPESRAFEANFVPAVAGQFRIQFESINPREGERPASAAFQVEVPDLEARRPEADHDSLRQIAEATGGKFLELDQLEAAFAAIPDRSARIPDDIVEPLWDSKLAWALFVLIIGTEWALRKAFGAL